MRCSSPIAAAAASMLAVLLGAGFTAGASGADDNPAGAIGTRIYESSIGGVVVAPVPAGPAGQGYLVFHKWCAGCHAPALTSPASRESANDTRASVVSQLALGTFILQQRYKGTVPAALEERTDLTSAVIAHYVRHGMNLMTGFRKTEISDADLDALVAYLTRNNP